MRDQQETYIYESPDNGQTVYRRPFGGTIGDRELHWTSPELQAKKELDNMWIQWIPILRDSQTDSELKAMLEKIQIYHKLRSQP